MPSYAARVELKDFGKLLTQLGDRANSALNTGLLAAAMKAQAIVVDETQRKGVFNTGYYTRAWKAERITEPQSRGFTVYNTAPYAGVIEEGRRPMPKRPPRAGPRRPRGSGPIPMDSLPPFRKAIAAWVMRKFSLPYEEAYPRMWAISNSINRNGIPARRVLGDAIPIIEKATRQEVERELRRALGRGRP